MSSAIWFVFVNNILRVHVGLLLNFNTEIETVLLWLTRLMIYVLPTECRNNCRSFCRLSSVLNLVQLSAWCWISLSYKPCNLARPADENRPPTSCMFCCCFLFIYLLLTIPFRPIIYRTDLRQIFRVGRTMAVDDQSEVSFSIPQGTLPQQPIFVGFIRRTGGCRWWTQAASGAAGRAKVGFASRLVC